MEKNLFGEENKKILKSNKESKIKISYDDKGRRIFDVSGIHQPEPPKLKEKVLLEIDHKHPQEIQFLKSKATEAMKEVQSKIINKEVVAVTKNPEESSIYFCKVCNCSLKDNQAYLDHINGKRHNKMLGVSMKVEKVEVDTVRSKLLTLKRKSDEMIKSKREFKKDSKESENNFKNVI